eukprot:1431851-Karenia_brevis.AAC.1
MQLDGGSIVSVQRGQLPGSLLSVRVTLSGSSRWHYFSWRDGWALRLITVGITRKNLLRSQNDFPTI